MISQSHVQHRDNDYSCRNEDGMDAPREVRRSEFYRGVGHTSRYWNIEKLQSLDCFRDLNRSCSLIRIRKQYIFFLPVIERSLVFVCPFSGSICNASDKFPSSGRLVVVVSVLSSDGAGNPIGVLATFSDTRKWEIMSRYWHGVYTCIIVQQSASIHG